MWSPFITSIEGVAREGARLKVRIAPPRGRAMTFTPTVRAMRPNRELRWLGHFLFPGILDGEHSLTIEPLPDGRSRLIQSERFHRCVSPMMGRTFDRTACGFEQMNGALKARSKGKR